MRKSGPDRTSAAGARGGPDPRLRALYAAAPAEFTARRDALARALAAEGHPEAQRVKRLRRPTAIVWLLNAVARERPDPLDALFAAGDRLRRAQVRAAGGDAAELRAASAAVHDALARLVAAARELAAGAGREVSTATLDQVERGLRAAATADVAARAPLRQGVLERVPEPGGAELLAGLAAVPRPRRTDQRSREDARAETAQRERERRRAIAEAERRERAVRAAEERVGSAERELEEARRRLAVARTQAEAARQAARSPGASGGAPTGTP